MLITKRPLVTLIEQNEFPNAALGFYKCVSSILFSKPYPNPAPEFCDYRANIFRNTPHYFG